MGTNEVDRFLERARSVLPGGWLGDTTLPPRMRIVQASGRGSRIFSVDGKEYLDFACGGGALILGHAHPAIVEAVCRQAALGSHFHGVTDRSVEFAERLVDAIPCAEAIRYTSSGAEATFFALRLARAYSGKRKIMKFEGAYHGHHDYGLMAVTPPDSSKCLEARPDSAGIPKEIQDLVVIAPFNDVRTTCRLIEEHAKDLAAVIVEPVQRAFDPMLGFLEALRDVTRKCGVLLIFDEVVTGFRLAYGGAQEYFGVTPDLAAYGKAVGAGYPIGVVAGPRDVMKLADPGRKGTGEYVYVSGTLSGNPLCCAAGLAALSVLERPNVFEAMNGVGNRLAQGLRDRFAEHCVAAQVTVVGSMFRVFFTQETSPPRTYRENGIADQALFVRFSEELFDRGVFMSPRPKSFISTVHSDADVALLLDATSDVCATGFGQEVSVPA